MFVCLALGLTAVVVMVAWWQLARAARQAREFDWARENAVEAPLVQVFREQLADLQAQRDRGELDAAAFDLAKSELEIRLLSDVQGDDLAAASTGSAGSQSASRAVAPVAQSRGRALAWSLMVAVPLLSIAGYLFLGRPLAIVPEAAMQAAGSGDISPAQLNELAEGLRARLAQEPDKAEGWAMLARVERARGQLDVALQALSKAQALAPSTELTLERAELVAQQQSGKFDGEPWALIRSVLRQDPKNLGALVLAGQAAMNAGQLVEAEGYWMTARQNLPPGTTDAQPLFDAINQVRAAQGKPPLDASTAAASPAAPAPAGARIVVEVAVSPEAQSRHKPSDVVFVYAQAPGSRMPLAVAKTTLGALPTQVVLDDSQAMAQGMALSSVPEVKVSVRISSNGQAVAQPGEWGASQSAVPTRGQSKLQLKITGPLS